MSQLSEYRRKVLKKSQEVLSGELGYEKWQTYAAQEQGKNPLPEDVKSKLEKKYKYKGPWPDQEAEEAAAGASVGNASIEEVAELRGALKAHVEYWSRGEERVLQRLEELARRIEALERRVGGG